MCFLAWKTRTAHASGKSALRLAISTAKRYCGSCQSGMVCHCWHAILGKPKIRNRGKCKRAFMRYRRCEVWSSSIWGKANLRAHYGSIGEHDAATQEREFLVGVQPRGTVRDHGTTAIEEAAEYLDCDITAVIKPDAKLCSELLEGLGLRKPNRTNAKAIATLADLIQEALGEKSISHGTRAT